MSLESALEEERLEVLRLLEKPADPFNRHASGICSTPSSPRQQYSSVIPPLYHSRTSSPNRAPISSLIDIASPPEQVPRAATTITWSPTVTRNGNSRHRPGPGPSTNGAPKLLKDRDKAQATNNLTPNQAYDFSMVPSVVPRKPRSRDPSVTPSARGRRSLSPGAGELLQSASPRSSSGRLSSPSPANPRNQAALETEPAIDLGHAYARLNDQALATSGGVLGTLPVRRQLTNSDGEHIRAGTGESITSEGGVRLQKDYDLEDDRAPEDSSDEESSSLGSSLVSDEEKEIERGRPGSRARSHLNSTKGRGGSVREAGIIKSMIRSVGDPGGGSKKGKKGGVIDARKGTGSMRRTSMSLLAAAEEERKLVSSRYKVRSLLLPSISITPSNNIPGASFPTTSRRSGVHPTTNFDLPSIASTPISSDTEADVLDLHRAQRMGMSISPIVSTPESQHVVRTILRGEYDTIYREAGEGNRRVRKYLVATDLSSEAQHALEWTIGTVLRDGDTLMAIYAIDQDTVEDGGRIVSDDGIIADAANQATVIGLGLTTISGMQTPGSASPRTPFQTMERSERSRERTKAERERYVAAEAITGLVTKLLKKTRLQVKCTIEVIHCKSPKHLLTEIIDLVEPTLVVLGSRGRSALKGVLLGSFSNYLVTKSSVPVMVARKKLKHTKKYASTNVRLANNLTANATPRQLADATVD